MRTGTLKQAIQQQRQELTARLGASMRGLAARCRDVFADRATVEALLAAELAGMPHCKHLFALDASGIARVVARPLAGRDAERFIREVEDWSAAEVVPFISARARSVVAQRQARGDLCAVLTSSTAYAAKPVADFLGIEHVLASRLVAEDGRLTGSIEEPFCFGGAKVTVAERWAREHEVDLRVSAFYTDSITDLPMLDAVGEPVVVNPDPRLRWTAWRRGWPVERW